MNIVNIHQAKAHLSSLVEQATSVETFIAKAGKPLVKVTALDAPTRKQKRRTGFMAGQIAVPDDFDRMDSQEIEERFGGER